MRNRMNLSVIRMNLSVIRLLPKLCVMLVSDATYF